MVKLSTTLLLCLVCVFIMLSPNGYCAAVNGKNKNCHHPDNDNRILNCSTIFDLAGIKDELSDESLVVINQVIPKLVLKREYFTRQHFPDVRAIYIQHNGEVEIQGNSFADFQGLENIQYMTIEHNLIKELENNAFFGLNHIANLQLNNNEINKINEDAFTGLDKLELLNLTDNNIVSIPSKAFAHLSNLNILLLDNNDIMSLDFVSNSLDSLEVLHLNYNRLTVVNANDLNILKNLKYLYLDFNQIKKITSDLMLPKLKFFNMQNNKLKEVSESTFSQCTALVNIYLKNNELKALTGEPFKNLHSLAYLNVENNGANKANFANLNKTVHILL